MQLSTMNGHIRWLRKIISKLEYYYWNAVMVWWGYQLLPLALSMETTIDTKDPPMKQHNKVIQKQTR